MVYTLRARDDSTRLRERLDDEPQPSEPTCAASRGWCTSGVERLHDGRHTLGIAYPEWVEPHTSLQEMEATLYQWGAGGGLPRSLTNYRRLEMTGLGMREAVILVLVGAMFLVYFLPTITGKIRGHNSLLAIFVLNLFLGWTFLGWVLSLVWACNSNTRAHDARP
jgi:hypothetical protein